MISAQYYFPSGFLWGTATASHQVEGQNQNNDWWRWEQDPDRILHNHKSGYACDWWNGGWKGDFDRAANDGQNAHRLSVEWSRIEPGPALWDDDALAYYREIVQGALDRGLRPMVTLHHFTNPIWIADRGGWEDPDTPNYFERYVRKVVSALKDLVDIWVTINEPNVYLYEAYGGGVFPPGKREVKRWPEVARNIILGHAAAYHAIHDLQQDAMVGSAHHFRGFRPASQRNPIERIMTSIRHTTFNNAFPRAFTDGHLRLLHWRDYIRAAERTQDFFGLNYYTIEQYHFDLRRPSSLFEEGSLPENVEASPARYIANAPEGMAEALRWARAYSLPIYITENGIEDEKDAVRPRYLLKHLHEIWKVINWNWHVKGYFHWTLVDNFEWDRGWTQQFGLWQLDRKSQERKRRRSSSLYAEICTSNSITSDCVHRYAPEILDELFPPKGPSELFDQETKSR